MGLTIGNTLYHPQIPLNGLAFSLDAGNITSYPGAGTNWNDMINNQSNTLVNGATFSNDKLGAIALDGTNDYITLPTSLAATLSDTASVVVWFKLNSTFNSSSSTCQALFDIYLNNSIRGLIYFSNDSGYVGRIGSLLIAGSIRNRVYTIQNSWNTEWTHLVATRQNSDFKIFINGVQESLTTITSTSFGAFSSSASAVSLGTSLYTFGSTYPACPFNGKIAQCSLYDRVLTDNEILKSYSELKSRYT